MSGIESVSSFSANTPATGKFSSMRAQISEKVTEKIHGQVEEKRTSAGVSEETWNALLADVTQVIEQQISSGTRPDPMAMRERIDEVFMKHGLSLPEGLQQRAGGPGFPGRYPGTGSANGSEFDVAQSLVEHLKDGTGGSRDYRTSANQFASNLVDEFIRFDVEA